MGHYIGCIKFEFKDNISLHTKNDSEQKLSVSQLGYFLKQQLVYHNYIALLLYNFKLQMSIKKTVQLYFYGFWVSAKNI